jgi:hypothetical protein
LARSVQILFFARIYRDKKLSVSLCVFFVRRFIRVRRIAFSRERLILFIRPYSSLEISL